MERETKRMKLEACDDLEDPNSGHATTFLDLPLEKLMRTIAQYLTPKDLFALRSCSRYFRKLVDDVGIPALGLVDLSNSSWTHDCVQGFKEIIDDAKIQAKVAFKKNIMERCRNARKLKLNAKWLTDDILYDFLKNNPSLEEIELDHCSTISGRALQPLVNCKNLVVLRITNMLWGDDEFLRNLCQHNNHILEIDFDDDRNEVISPEAIKEFVSKQPHLRYICLPYIDNYKINDEIIETIIEVCKNLRSIKLAGWRKTDDRPLVRLALNCEKLKKIDLHELNWRADREILILMTAKGIEFRWGGGSNWLLDLELYIFHEYDDDDEQFDEDNRCRPS